MKRRGELSSHGLERGYSMRGETEVMSGRTESFKDQNFTSVKCKLPLSHVIGSLCRRESTKICMVKCVHGGKSERRIVLEISNYFVLLFKIKLGRKCIKSKGKVNGSEDIERMRG